MPCLDSSRSGESCWPNGVLAASCEHIHHDNSSSLLVSPNAPTTRGMGPPVAKVRRAFSKGPDGPFVSFRDLIFAVVHDPCIFNLE
jgi:hypothetical protein